MSMFTTGEAKVQTNNNAEQDLSDVQTMVDNLQNPTGYSPDSDGALQPSESNTYAKEHTGDENSYYYGTGWSEDYSQIDPNLIDKKGNYNESLSNAEFINQSIAERYGDEIDNYQITNPNDYGVNATNGQRTSEWDERLANWDKETKIYDNPEALLGTTALAGMGGLALFHQYNTGAFSKANLNSKWTNFKGLSALKKIGSIGKKVLGPLGTIAGVTISELIGDNADKFSGTQKLARIGIQSATSLAGGALGGLIGSAIGPMGTIAGGVLGSLAGDWVGNKIVNSSLGDSLGISDKSAIKTAHDSYTDKGNRTLAATDK